MSKSFNRATCAASLCHHNTTDLFVCTGINVLIKTLDPCYHNDLTY